MASLNTQENPVENARGLDERKYKGSGVGETQKAEKGGSDMFTLSR